MKHVSAGLRVETEDHRAAGEPAAAPASARHRLNCDVVVVGGGPAGPPRPPRARRRGRGRGAAGGGRRTRRPVLQAADRRGADPLRRLPAGRHPALSRPRSPPGCAACPGTSSGSRTTATPCSHGTPGQRRRSRCGHGRGSWRPAGTSGPSRSLAGSSPVSSRQGTRCTWPPATRVALGQRVVLAGTGLFLLAAAAAVIGAGGRVSAVVELNTPYRPGRTGLAAARFPSRLRELSGYAATLGASRVRVLQGRRVVAALGSGRVEAVQVAAPDGRRHPRPGAHHRGRRARRRAPGRLRPSWSGSWAPDVTGTSWATSSPSPTVSGAPAFRVLGTRRARPPGSPCGPRLAAGKLAAAAAAAIWPAAATGAGTTRRRRPVHRKPAIRGADIRAVPGDGRHYLAMPDATMVCRCEGVTVGDSSASAAATGRSDVSGVKSRQPEPAWVRARAGNAGSPWAALAAAVYRREAWRGSPPGCRSSRCRSASLLAPDGRGALIRRGLLLRYELMS